MSDRDDLIHQLEALHACVDDAASKLTSNQPVACRRGCAACCIDDLTVFDIEAERIRRAMPAGAPHPSGRCAFLDDEDSCRVYAVRPYICRTQGLPLRWFDGEFEFRDICELNDGTTPVETLAPDACWTIGPMESALASLEEKWDGGEMRRVSLRQIFND